MASNSIRFPRMHVAQSTSNRIINVARGLPAPAQGNPLPPELPDVTSQGQLLDAQLATPPGPAALPAGTDGAVASASLAGDSLTNPAVDSLLGVPANP